MTLCHDDRFDLAMPAGHDDVVMTLCPPPACPQAPSRSSMGSCTCCSSTRPTSPWPRAGSATCARSPTCSPTPYSSPRARRYTPVQPAPRPSPATSSSQPLARHVSTRRHNCNLDMQMMMALFTVCGLLRNAALFIFLSSGSTFHMIPTPEASPSETQECPVPLATACTGLNITVFLTRVSLADILVLAGIADAGRMAPPAGTRISVRTKYIQGHVSRIRTWIEADTSLAIIRVCVLVLVRGTGGGCGAWYGRLAARVRADVRSEGQGQVRHLRVLSADGGALGTTSWPRLKRRYLGEII